MMTTMRTMGSMMSSVNFQPPKLHLVPYSFRYIFPGYLITATSWIGFKIFLLVLIFRFFTNICIWNELVRKRGGFFKLEQHQVGPVGFQMLFILAWVGLLIYAFFSEWGSFEEMINMRLFIYLCCNNLFAVEFNLLTENCMLWVWASFKSPFIKVKENH